MFAPMMQYRDGRPNDPISMRVVGETPKLPMLTDMRARPPIGSVTPLPQPQPFQPQPASPQFGQVQQQPQFNQQGMQQMMQFMQQMMQMFSMMSGQGGQGGFGGGFNQRPPMFGGGYGGGMGGGFGQGGYQQFQQPQQRPMPRYPKMQNNYSQSPFGRY
jgi:hypothetical protein